MKKIEDLAKQGMIICGSPDSVAQQLEQHQKEVGYGKLIAMMQFGTLPHDMTKRSMELFATQVIRSSATSARRKPRRWCRRRNKPH